MVLSSEKYPQNSEKPLWAYLAMNGLRTQTKTQTLCSLITKTVQHLTTVKPALRDHPREDQTMVS